jgi:exodeoxyribonuclease-3
MVKIATWNVNSVKARLGHLIQWLGDADPDVVLLQETKVTDELFPRLEVEDAGYNLATSGQKTYNGVAILSKQPIDILATELPGDQSDEQARYIEGFTGDVRVASIYLPNGNPVDSEKFDYKLAWMERLHDHVWTILQSEDAIVLGGDYNVAPEDGDVHDPPGWANDALCRIESRRAYRKLLHLGLTDAFRVAASPGGTTGAAAGRATKGCASITCCYHLRLPTASRPARSTRNPAPWKNRRITRRSGANYTIDGRH